MEYDFSLTVTYKLIIITMQIVTTRALQSITDEILVLHRKMIKSCLFTREMLRSSQSNYT